MVNTLIYFSVDDSITDFENNEQSELITQGKKPKIGETVDMGAGRLYQVVKIEAYKSEGKTVYVSLVVPPVEHNPEDGWILPIYDSEDEPGSFFISFSPTGKNIHYGWDMKGETPEGKIFGVKEVDGKLTTVPTPYVIAEVDSYYPERDGFLFQRIDLLTCTEELIAA